MTVVERVRRAFPTTVAIHVFQMLLAGTFALPLALTVEFPHVSAREPVAAWISALTLGASLGGGTGRHAVLPLAAAGLCYPWLSVAWLRALEHRGPFFVHARQASRRYLAAGAIAAITLATVAALAAGAYFAALWTGRLTWHRVDARGLDLLRAAAILPFAAAVLPALTIQDAAYAALSRDATQARAAFRTALATLSVALVARRAMIVALQLAVALAAGLIPRATLGAGATADVAVFVATQLAALALTCARASWLALVQSSVGRLAVIR